MTNNARYFDTIPDTILSLIFENLNVDDFLHNITTCKQFKSAKMYTTTLLLYEKYINHIPQILNHIENNRIKRIIISCSMSNIHMQQLAHLQHVEVFIAKSDRMKSFLFNNKLNIICNNFKKLTCLSLNNIFVMGNGWANLFKLNLRELYLIKCYLIHDCHWIDAVTLQNIEKLDISYSAISNEQFACITNMHNIVCLNIAECDRYWQLTDKDFENIINLQNLQELTMTLRCGFTNQSMKYLTNLKQLHKLNIRACTTLTDIGLLHVADIVGLQELTIVSCDIITQNVLNHMAKIIPKFVYEKAN